MADKALAHAGINTNSTTAPQDKLERVTWPVFLVAVLDNVIKDRHWRQQVVARPTAIAIVMPTCPMLQATLLVAVSQIFHRVAVTS